MTKLLKSLFVFLVCLSSGWVYAQQDAQFSQYMFNGFYYNPAVAGADNKANFLLMHRTQWAGYDATFDDGGSPQTQIFSATAPFVYVSNTGVGLHAVRDVRGPISSLEAHLSFAYHLSLGDGKLSIGARAGIYNQSIDFSKFRFNDESDPVSQELSTKGVQSELKPDFAFGLWYAQEKFYVGISSNHLAKSQISFGLEELENALARNLYFTAGYNYTLNDQWLLQPSVLIKNLPENGLKTTSMEFSVLGTYNQKFWGGLAYRQSDAATAMVGVYPTKDNRLRIGYAFDYTISGAQGKAPTSHEIFVSYGMPIKRFGKPTQETPRHGTK
ncbi:MAG: type IX secretion system membrane protein PorP/SprF [Thermonemataceae bacterium]|nr:type IX secretion system membrane protein PorP/SprF [Thermonemataceae bacterium]